MSVVRSGVWIVVVTTWLVACGSQGTTQQDKTDHESLSRKLEFEFSNQQYAAAEQTALSLFKKGDVEAAYSLGLIYFYGLSNNKDPKKSEKYLRFAAQKNHPAALFDLGRLLIANKDTFSNYKDYGKDHMVVISAKRFIEQSALRGEFRGIYWFCNIAKDKLAPAQLRMEGAAWCLVGSKVDHAGYNKLKIDLNKTLKLVEVAFNSQWSRVKQSAEEIQAKMLSR